VRAVSDMMYRRLSLVVHFLRLAAVVVAVLQAVRAVHLLAVQAVLMPQARQRQRTRLAVAVAVPPMQPTAAAQAAQALFT
jgi:hypothetical protein